MSELSPDQEVILDRFMINLHEGGIDACRTMVNDLAAQADMTSAVVRGVDDIQREMVAMQLSTSTDDLMATRSVTDGVTRDSLTARSQHSFALFLLRRVEEALLRK